MKADLSSCFLILANLSKPFSISKKPCLNDWLIAHRANKLEIKVFVIKITLPGRLWSHLELRFSSRFIPVVGRIQFLVLVGLRSPFSSRLSAMLLATRGHLQLPATWPSPKHGCLFLQDKQQSISCSSESLYLLYLTSRFSFKEIHLIRSIYSVLDFLTYLTFSCLILLTLLLDCFVQEDVLPFLISF